MTNNPLSVLEEETNGKIPFQKIFESQPGLLLIFSPEFIIQAATDAYLRETLTVRKKIVGRYVWEVFPDNPKVPEASSTSSLKASVQRVLSSGKPHQMNIFQYDIPDPDQPGCFFERYWSTTNTPVFNQQGSISGIIHEIINVTEQVKADRQLKESQRKEQEARAQAEQQRVRLERLFQQAPAALAILEGPELVYGVVNESYQQLFPGRELVGLPLFEALPELKEQPIALIIQQVYQTGKTFEGKEALIPVARYQDQPMEDIYWNFIYQALYDAQGQVNGILIFALDVTDFVMTRRQVEKGAAALQTLNRELEERVVQRTRELQLAQAEAERQQQRLHSIFQQAPVAIGIFRGKDHIIELVNSRGSELLEKSAEELLGKTVFEALPEIAGQGFEAILSEVFHTGIPFEAKEIPATLKKDGQLVTGFYNTIYQPLWNAEREVTGIIQIATEVSEQVKARQAIEASAQKLRLITDALPVLIGYLDREEKYRFANQAYQGWFNQKPEDLLGKPIREVIGEKAYQNVKEYIDRALAGERLDYEAWMPYRENFSKYIRTSYVPDVQAGAVVGFYTLVTDVTEQVEARRAVEESEQQAKVLAAELAAANQELQSAIEELAIANQQLTHTNVDLDNFIYTASHDLKAPILNIEGLIGALLEELPPEWVQATPVKHLTDLMADSVQRFKRTIYHLTEITKLQKETNPEPSAVNLAGVIADVQLDLAPAIQATQAQLEVEVTGCPTVRFSEKNLRSIIYNLLSNAIKYHSPERTPLVRVHCYQTADYQVLSVQDNGLGMDLTQQPKLFTLFQRLHNHVEGSGIGLYMVKKIIENSGGKIEVQSKVGEGTVFQVYFRRHA